MALINDPVAMRQIAGHYQAILDICYAQRYSDNECRVCGSTNRVQRVEEFLDGPYLCLRHRCGWRGVWVLHGYGDPKLYFAKWLASQLLPEAKKIEPQ